jgi:hypothetical protein
MNGFEEWRPILGGSHEVSSLGRIRNARTGRLLTPYNAHGYRRIGIRRGSRGSDRRLVRRYVHSWVMEAFVGPCPAGQETNHRDGDKAHNALSNLEYVTKSENARHAIAAGLWHLTPPPSPRGEAHPLARLTEAQVLTIRQQFTGEYGQIPKLAGEYGVTRNAIKLIVTGRTWRHLLSTSAS